MGHILSGIIVVILVGRVEPPISPTVSAPGSNATLECSFSPSKSLNLTNLIINWQHEETVVHSFYLGQDQLDRQGRDYRGRTHLFKDKLLEGNASLRLTSVQPDDQGEYTCHVSDEQGSTKGKALLILAALFDEPLLYLQSTCNSFNITATLSNGFPQPELRWHDSSGREINQTSSVHLDARGLYTVSSAINFSPSGVEEVTMEMKLEALNQSFTRSLLLHPLPDHCKGQLRTDMMSISSDRYVGLLSLVLMLRFMNQYVRKF
ncbi:hypothetical protein NFI96_020827 [Prochilodus magdalenae]|nr:hypothetical protein NFI96_020827 [Prochilodus magdalenae]